MCEFCCDGAAVSQNETLSTGSLEKAEVALYFARDIQICRTEWLYFPYIFDVSIFEINN